MRSLLLLSIAPMVLTGCGVDVQIREDLTTHPPERIAILPFEAPSPEERGSGEMRFIRRIFFGHWANLAFRDMPIAETDRLLKQRGYETTAAILEADPATLGEALGVDALVYGRITSISNIAPVLGYRRALGGSFRLVDCRRDPQRPLWEAEFTESKWGGPLIDAGQILRGIREQIENSSSLAFYRIADRFSRKIVETVPAVSQTHDPKTHQPRIETFEVRPSRAGALRPGDRIDVSLVGDPARIASFDIGRVHSRIPMTETNPGLYRGTYVVQVGDRIEAAPVRARLATIFGETAIAEGNGTAVTILALPPAPPTGLEATSEPGWTILSWRSGTGNSNDGSPSPPAPVEYRIYRADGTPALFREIGRETTTRFRDAAPGKSPAFYSIVALDGDGNRSYPSPTLRFHPTETPSGQGG